MVLNGDTKRSYVNTCSRINATLDHIYSICFGLGYANITRDNLRIVADIRSTNLYRIPNSLPVLIMPFWDNGPSSRYAIPGSDGHACMFRLGGNYESSISQHEFLYAVNRSVREAKTVEWLDRPGGSWKNGWHEDTDGIPIF